YEYYIVSNCPDGPLQSFTDTFFTTCDTATTGILNQLSYENKVFVYPNPSADMINISFEEPVHGSIELQLYNDRGELIDIKIINAYGATQLENIFFNVDKTGIYFLSVLHNEARQTIKYILKIKG
ncbi:MAG: T9SS type A sorting domain-containing protein, partial [Fimbriimonadaceae bacterium]|nr:T9SS type A sorting domain-containing protein [Chitinophagales bacterium]